MAGGGMQQGQAQSPVTQALSSYQPVPNSVGGAQAYGAGAAPQAQQISQLQQILQRMGAQSPGQQSPAMGIANTGMQLAKMGQGAPAPMPMQHPMMGGPQPLQAAQPPMMGGIGGMMGAGQGMPPGGLQAILRQRGFM